MSQAQLIPEVFSPSVSLHAGRPATTSLEVANFFGKRHDNICRDIRGLIESTPENFRALNFEETFRTIPGPNNSERQETYFILYRDGFMLLVMGYTGKKALAMKLAYIEAFNRMEEELARQKEAARNITQDIVDFPGSISITPSSVADRKPLRALVGSWAKLSNAPFDACWNQLKAAFNLANIKELPQEWIPDALAW
ncbi:Rha family transcriptional regulator, partial [Desulfovibrio piger]|uniref:Rha family transcriptional regulator n=1 Tax=Desulfovibrio piger TaxID=901 RepID=UPI0026EA7AAC